MIKAVIFDIDNTLYSYDEAHEPAIAAVQQYALEHLGMDNETLMTQIKLAAAQVKDTLGADCAALHDRTLRFQVMLERNRLPLTHAAPMGELYWDTLLEHAEPTPGSLACLKRLKEQGYVLGIGTDMTIEYQLKKLNVLQMLPLIDFIVSSEEANVEKPHSKVFSVCAEKAGVSPQECLFIGDSLKKDVLGPRSMGMHSLWYCPDPEKAKLHPEVETITHFDQLEGMLENI